MPMSNTLRYLHLSDFHFTPGEMAGTDWAANRLKQDVVNHSLLEFLEDHLQHRPLDFLILTGDIAFSGKREEYQVAAKFFQRLADITGLPPNRVYPVAGNHDVNRADVPRSHRRFYRFESQEDLADTLADPDLRGLILRKFSEFNDFAEKIMGRRHFHDEVFHLTEGLALPKGGRNLKINLVGLNSALFAGFDGDEAQGLALGMFQVEKALAQMAEDAPLSIGFFHHPFPSLHDADVVSANRLKFKLDLILHGHVHQATGAAEHSGAGKAVILGAGAAYESRTSRNGGNLVEIDLVSGEGQVHFFKYLPSHHCWNQDNDVCPRDPEGVFRFQVDALRGFAPNDPAPAPRHNPPEAPPIPTPSSTQFHFIHDYALPKNFTGRKTERQNLANFFHGNDPTRVLAIRALGGMGKSCLARQAVADLPQKDTAPYSRIAWFSFYEARTEDEGYAFQTLLARLSPEFVPEPREGAARTRYLREQLSLFLDQHPVLLVLDGLEVIQHTQDPHSPHYGELQETYRETLRLLQHACNPGPSRVLITTRVALTQLAGAVGFAEWELPVWSREEAAMYLRTWDIRGTPEEILHCAELFGGHPLCLRAAGHQLHRLRIPAAEVERLVGDVDLFQRSPEGARVAKIVDSHRAELPPDQSHFLQMLSIHPRSVTARHFPALVRDFGQKSGENGENRATRDAFWVQIEILVPLETRGLVEALPGVTPEDTAYSAHPLMKLAFANWLKPTEKQQAHEQWAQAAQASPALAGSPEDAKSLEALQPWLEVIEHYLVAEDWDSAWAVYRGRGVDDRLTDLAYYHRLWALGERLEQALAQGWDLATEPQAFLYGYLGQACSGLGHSREALRYREKQFAAAQASGEEELIVVNGAILAETQVHLGQIPSAQAVLANIQDRADALSAGFAKRGYQNTQAKTALFAGEYVQAIAGLELARKDETDDHNRILTTAYLGEAQIRAGLLPAAEQTLRGALQAAEQRHIIKLIPIILQNLTWLALKQRQIDTARAHNDRRVALKKSLDLPNLQDDGWLLVHEGQFAQARDQAQAELARLRAEGVDQAAEIANLLLLAQAQQGLGEEATARATCQQARDLMTETGCWRCKDWLAETEARFSPPAPKSQ